jgi:hypothetical protein
MAQSKKEVAVTSTKQVAVSPTSVLPSLIGASPEIKARMLEVKDNMESVENFKLPRAKSTSTGFELIEGEQPIMEIEGVIIHTKKTNVYYSKPYNPAELTAPDCFSLDGFEPDKSITIPVSTKCKGCPMAEFGSNSMKSGKACRNLKPMYLLLSDESIMPRQLTVAPTSLKAANQYLMDLTERGISYRKIKTKITCYKENARDTYCKLKFAMGAKLNEQQVQDVEFLRNQWLPIMNDQAIDMGAVEQPQTQPQEPQPHVGF